MVYDAVQRSLSVRLNDFDRAAVHFLHALRCVREAAGLSLDRYECKGPLRPADHAMKAILDGAAAIGLSFGAEWGHELDLRPNSPIWQAGRRQP